MIPKFIELHDGEDPQQEIMVNVEHIVSYHVGDDGTTVIISDNKKYYSIAESYEDVRRLIEETGILIHRDDTRLKTDRPLTFDEMAEMIGEPVWNSNLLRWELVKKADDLYITTCSTGVYDNNYDDSELIKTPLYRMRKDYE